MKTIKEMQNTPAAELRTIALTAECRFYAMACSQMAAAQDQYKLDGSLTLTVRSHVERAKTALLRAQEVEEDRVKRTARDMAARGTKSVDAGVCYGDFHTNVAETFKNDNIRGHGYRR